jgi:hypothetical protein
LAVLLTAFAAAPALAQSSEAATKEIDRLQQEVYKPGHAQKANQQLEKYCDEIRQHLSGLSRVEWEPVVRHCDEVKNNVSGYNGGHPYFFIPDTSVPVTPGPKPEPAPPTPPPPPAAPPPIQIPSAPPTFPVTIPAYFCSAEQKKAVVDGLFAEASAESQYINRLYDLLDAANRKHATNAAGYSALEQAFKSAVAVSKAIDKDYYQAQRTPVKDCTPIINGWLLVGYGKNSSQTTITSPTDRQKTKQDPSQAFIAGRVDLGPWFATGQITFAGTPHGTFTDVFPAFPAANTSATINSGQIYGMIGDAGYTVYNSADLKVGVFGGFYSYDEFLYGAFPGFTGQFPLLASQWRAGEGGVNIDKTFMVGSVPFDFSLTAAGLFDHLRSGAFGGNGGGARVSGNLSFPIGAVRGNVFAQYTDMNASGSNTGVPLTFNNQNWLVGAGISYAFGGDPVAVRSSTSMPLKAPPK